MSKLSTLAKRLFSASLCAVLALSTVPMEPIAAWAEDLAESQGGGRGRCVRGGVWS
jgi:hypothetical protein